MGEYIQEGLCYRVKVSKTRMENNKINYEEIMEGLVKEIPLKLYDGEETENNYSFTLKDEILENGQLTEFLTEQYKLLNANEDELEEIIAKLRNLNKSDEIIKFAKEKSYENFQFNSIYHNLDCGKWRKSIIIEYELVNFYVVGEIVMECHNEFLRYIETLIKQNNAYKVSEAVKIMIG